MTKGAKKIWIMLVSFGVFLAGVAALRMTPSTTRTALLWGCILVLLSIAVGQTLVRMNKKRQ